MSGAVTVLGSCNMDLVAYAPAAPGRGETVLGTEFRTVPGGKGANQAVAAARAGAEVTMIGAVGTDDFGVRVRAALEESAVDTQALRTVAGPTGTAHIVVDARGDNSIVVVPSANATVTGLGPGDENRIAGADNILMQLELPVSAALAGSAAARRSGVRVVLTPAPVQPLPDELFAAVDLLVPNEHEATALTGEHDPVRALAALLERVPEVVVTLGERGCLHGVAGGRPHHVDSFRVRAVDTTAAGDTFVGALAAFAGSDRLTADALRWATAAAALSVQRPGASSSMPSQTEIADFLGAH